jgi:hypothetical protein
MKNNLFSASIFLCFLLPAIFGNAQNAQKKYVPFQHNPVSKNYYFSWLCLQDSAISNLLRDDSIMGHWNRSRTIAIKTADSICNKNAICMISKLHISDDEIISVGKRLLELKKHPAFVALIKHHLIPSGAYNQLVSENNQLDSLLFKAWQHDAKGINYALSVYAQGKKPNYPLIDSNSLKISSLGSFPRSYISQVTNILQYLTDLAATDSNILTIPTKAVSLFLEINERTQSSDFEPMHLGVNEAAVKKINTLNWSNYPYSVILVPGAGPSEVDVALSAEAMIRLRIASVQFYLKKAPFIIVSGGKVHPYKTKYCEAIEMKKYCVEQLGIPASAIIVDPHARHTTTNMRNASRLMIRYGMPIEKPGLVCTTPGQSMMIANTLPSRCMIELGYVPYKNGKRLSNTLTEFYALSSSLQIDADEPIDP